MKDYILEFPFFYRLYQKLVRKKKHEYHFFKYIFSNISKDTNIRMLDICSGDSHVLNYTSEYISDYMGIDLNIKYQKNLSSKWPKYTFLNLDITQQDTLLRLKKFDPNFIFMNGAIHHLDDKTIRSISLLINNFKDAYFLSVDPLNYNNSYINKIMIQNDRGKFIRSPDQYSVLMNDFKNLIVDDFYIMSFKNIFHYKKLNLEKFYNTWHNDMDL